MKGALIAALVGGCSFVTAWVPAEQPEERIECPDVAVSLDTLLAAVAIPGAVLLGVGIADHADHSDHTGSLDDLDAAMFMGAGGTLMIVSGIAAASAIYGYTMKKRCRRFNVFIDASESAVRERKHAPERASAITREPAFARDAASARCLTSSSGLGSASSSDPR